MTTIKRNLLTQEQLEDLRRRDRIAGKKYREKKRLEMGDEGEHITPKRPDAIVSDTRIASKNLSTDGSSKIWTT